MKIPYVKAQGAGNDFLLTRVESVPAGDRAGMARAFCDRRLGVGADGWYVVSPGGEAAEDCDAAIHLFNSDGSEAELSGNGTRCVAAMLVDEGHSRETIRIMTGAGPRELRLLEREGRLFVFEMNMGRPFADQSKIRWTLPLEQGAVEVATLNVGNPQCAVFVDEFPEGWEKTAAEIERHNYFPNRTNVSYVRPVDKHTIEARFYERGAGFTMSSGTGSMGAAVAAIARGVARSPVCVKTLAGDLNIRWDDDVYLTGPAQLIAHGEFYWVEE